MSALSQLDLSLKLSKQEEAEQLAAAQERLLALRLQLGGLTADELGPPLCVLFEGWDASGKGGAIKRLVDHLDPRHVASSQFAAPTPRREAPPLPAGASGRRCPAGAGWPSSTAPGTGACWSSASRASPTKDEWKRAYDEINDFERTLARRGHDPRQVLAAHLRRGAAASASRSAQKDPLKAWKLTDEDWRNREKRAAVRGGGRGDGRADRPRVRAVAPRRGGVEALRAREGGRDGDRRDRGRKLAVSRRWALRACFWARVLARIFFLRGLLGVRLLARLGLGLHLVLVRARRRAAAIGSAAQLAARRRAG